MYAAPGAMVCQTACMHCSTFNRPQKFSKAMHYTQMLQRLQLRKHKFRTAPRLRLQEHRQHHLAAGKLSRGSRRLLEESEA